MKPGNLSERQGAKSVGKRKMRVRYSKRTSNLRCVHFLLCKRIAKKEMCVEKEAIERTSKNYGKKTVYF